MNKKTQITLQDIAVELNVTKVTVSKALRDHPDISKEKTELVKETARKMGYYPNFAARNLSSKKTNTIGVIVPVIANNFFAQVIESIYDYAFKNDYEIILAVSQEDSERERKHLETMLSMRVDGIMISLTEHSSNMDMFRKIKKMGVPLVFFDRVPNMKAINSVTVDNVLGAFIAVEQAINKGYKEIGFLAGYDDINIGRERMEGFNKALEKYKIKKNNKWIIHAGYSKADGYNGFMELHKRGNIPEFIFAVTFPVALGVYCAAEELGLKIPTDFDILCFGNSNINKYLKPSLSCIDQDADELARQSVDSIFNIINSTASIRAKEIKITPKLIIRETCI
ncbi:MAG: LacI family DNA-binding transcriptional regulator [Melioribacteraceae bacterium]|nr:LacI family DNA-binding transcriptional regulator [Melioribacteraceae bacterium]